MRSADFGQLLAQLKDLSLRQRERVLAYLSVSDQREKVIGILEKAAEASLACPQCRSLHFHRHGRADGLQRFRCIDCGRTFNSLSGTPLARLRLKSKWLEYSRCLLHATTVRRAAIGVAIHKNTSFRWRHRFLTLPKTDRPEKLTGILEADEMYCLESEKGARHLDRPPRKRGEAATKRGLSFEQVCILVARDRTGQTIDYVTGKGPVNKRQLKRCLPPVMDDDVLLVSDANAAYRYFARDQGISHEIVNASASERVRGAIHIQNVNAYHSRYKGWVSRFHGVASHYLPNYLGWHWAVDR
ncbi:IS1595 family transposase, partial [Duganella sp. FT3S]